MEVAGISNEAIIDAYRLRLILEPLATELAVPRLNADDISFLEALHAELIAASESGHLRNFGEINGAWHARIYEAAGSPLLKDIIQRLWERVPWRTLWGIRGWAENSTSEHETIMEALRSGDAAEARERMRVHLQSSETWQMGSHQAASEAAEPSAEHEVRPAAE
jgi:DNA-binding GntR family transcriptional regulator